MQYITILVIALGLAMDALAVSISSGIAIKDLKTGDALKIAGFFGGFQAFMPILGWLAGRGLKNFITGFDHWIGFGLLVFVGVRMMLESGKQEEQKHSPRETHVLLVLAVATSIDALAVGLSISFLHMPIVVSALIIGVVTFLICLAGVFAGKKLGQVFAKRFEVAGGLILIAIGVKILAEHLL
ncbi:hypothetical protein COY52_11360 [Candidatus Desantisbacteria bacterium CG_4_10_14_0_8_um_filter_48_22]|uniref:Putative manganese efflux pump MntP n=1 Tax=Candidatus Desantisbacteria bacterium CG_4_10_14_0_8_um_filter_48_22 TaxID=1974543 RepID=A0A2M7S578_9BACT|nr:MAG: hypothetical protein COS16_10035 [Candidatus Desantisbacteria bacterium CG02_land_8_20_14_3_00_49_13]PIZ14710.1 MAG: hypothetical protein COY52_11360 [Candidatus Desantisbacteria bacterium CG_4_10_14_0_8_um_filter_48_22]